MGDRLGAASSADHITLARDELSTAANAAMLPRPLESTHQRPRVHAIAMASVRGRSMGEGGNDARWGDPIFTRGEV